MVLCLFLFPQQTLLHLTRSTTAADLYPSPGQRQERKRFRTRSKENNMQPDRQQDPVKEALVRAGCATPSSKKLKSHVLCQCQDALRKRNNDHRNEESSPIAFVGHWCTTNHVSRVGGCTTSPSGPTILCMYQSLLARWEQLHLSACWLVGCCLLTRPLRHLLCRRSLRHCHATYVSGRHCRPHLCLSI